MSGDLRRGLESARQGHGERLTRDDDLAIGLCGDKFDGRRHPWQQPLLGVFGFDQDRIGHETVLDGGRPPHRPGQASKHFAWIGIDPDSDIHALANAPDISLGHLRLNHDMAEIGGDHEEDRRRHD